MSLIIEIKQTGVVEDVYGNPSENVAQAYNPCKKIKEAVKNHPGSIVGGVFVACYAANHPKIILPVVNIAKAIGLGAVHLLGSPYAVGVGILVAVVALNVKGIWESRAESQKIQDGLNARRLELDSLQAEIDKETVSMKDFPYGKPATE